MNRFDYEVAINQLKLGKDVKLNDVKYDLVPTWVSNDFLQLFLPYLEVVGDSREQDDWVERACKYYGIKFTKAKKDKKAGTENLKEGDYTFNVHFGNQEFSYVGIVAYERKGSISEFYGNCTGYDKETKVVERDRLQREFDRFSAHKYKKVVLMLEFGENVLDLVGLEFQFRGKGGKIVHKNVNNSLFSAVMSWRQPNNKCFDVIQSNNRKKLFWLFLLDCYYFFRNEIRILCRDKGLFDRKEVIEC